MAYTFAWAGDPDRTSGYFTTPGRFVHSNFQSGFPAGRASSDGGSPVKCFNKGSDYISGPAFTEVWYGGNNLANGEIFNSGGGGFEHRIVNSGGTVYFGRNTTVGGVGVYENGVYGWAGALCGWLQWATVAAAPSMVSAVPAPGGKVTVKFSGSGDTGGDSMTGWQLQYATNSSFSGATTISSTGTSVLTLTPGVRYWFRARGSNSVGWSPWSGSINAQMISGGKVRVNNSWLAAQVRVRQSGAWQNGLVKVRADSVWKDPK